MRFTASLLLFAFSLSADVLVVFNEQGKHDGKDRPRTKWIRVSAINLSTEPVDLYRGHIDAAAVGVFVPQDPTARIPGSTIKDAIGALVKEGTGVGAVASIAASAPLAFPIVLATVNIALRYWPKDPDVSPVSPEIVRVPAMGATTIIVRGVVTSPVNGKTVLLKQAPDSTDTIPTPSTPAIPKMPFMNPGIDHSLLEVSVPSWHPAARVNLYRSIDYEFDRSKTP